MTLDLHSDACCETASLGVDGMGRIVVGAMGGDAAKWRVVEHYNLTARPFRWTYTGKVLSA